MIQTTDINRHLTSKHVFINAFPAFFQFKPLSDKKDIKKDASFLCNKKAESTTSVKPCSSRDPCQALLIDTVQQFCYTSKRLHRHITRWEIFRVSGSKKVLRKIVFDSCK